MNEPTYIGITRSQLHAEPGFQSREKNDPAVVEEYTDAMRRGDDLPAILVAGDERKGEYWLADGFHRLAAMDEINEGNDDYRLTVQIVTGGHKEAKWLSSGANRSHGLRRSNADKRRAARLALEVSPDLADRAIAEHVGVSQPFISGVRKDLEGNGDIPQIKERKGMDGKVRTQSEPKEDPEPLPADSEETTEYVDSLHDRVKAIRDEIEVEIEAGNHAFAEVNGEMFTHIFDELMSVLKKQCRPHKPCPHCGGEGCKQCADRGFISKDRWELLSQG